MSSNVYIDTETKVPSDCRIVLALTRVFGMNCLSKNLHSNAQIVFTYLLIFNSWAQRAKNDNPIFAPDPIDTVNYIL